MKKTGSHPILISVIAAVAAFLAAGILGGVLTSIGFPSDISTSLARIAVSVLLLAVFFKEIDFAKSFSGLPLGVPALVFAVWNCVYNPLSGMKFGGLDAVPSALINGLAPALFEETLFRGIMIGKMRKAGMSDMAAWLIPAVLFGVIHLTNMVSGDVASAVVQACYAVVIGLLFGAVYIRSGDLVSVIFYHAVIDFTSKLFTGTPGEASLPVLAAFVLMLAGVTIYSYRLISGTGKKN